MITLCGFDVLLDQRVEKQLVQFWTYATLNERVGVTDGKARTPQDRLTVRLIHKVNRRTTTLRRMVESVMNATTTGRVMTGPMWDFRADLTPEQWLNSMPRDISPRLTPPRLPQPGARATRVDGTHAVRAIVVDDDFEPSGPIYAYDTRGGFNIKYNSRSLAREICGSSRTARVYGASLYDFRKRAFMVYD